MRTNLTLLKRTITCCLLLAGGVLTAQTAPERLQIQSKSNVAVLTALETELSQNYEAQKSLAIQRAQLQNIPIKLTLEDGGIAELQSFADDGSPIYYRTFNVAAARSTRTNHLNIGGSLGLSLDGQNMTANVWDGGHARVSHQEYDGAGGTNRVTILDAASEGGTQLNYHAAHVTGTITASGVQANAKGMAPRSKVRASMWNNDIAEATAEAANGMLVSNHSYGYRGDLIPDQYFGAYIQVSRDWDNIMYNAPYYLMVVAAGNDGDQNYYNGNPLAGNSYYDKLSGHATSKNNMVVANAQDANVDANGDLNSVTINSSSSEGPTDDYRIKPDITGNGTSVYSTYESSDTAYASITGTSMASPNVTGSLLLLQQHYNNINGNFMRSATLKGVALHTADDAGSNGPDVVYGWGLMNAKRAAEVITANGSASKMEELTLNSGQSYSVQVTSDGVNDLLTSISWTDVAGAANSGTNSSTAALVNDLDVRVTKDGNSYTPWRLTGVTTNGKGDNTKDNYERVDIANASGTYTITVTHKGSLSSGSQAFSLIVTGLGNAVADTEAPTAPTTLSTSGVTSSSVALNWNASSDNVGVTAYDVYQANTVIATVSGTSYTVTGLAASTTYEFKVKAKDAAGNESDFSNTVSATTPEVGITYCASASSNTNDEYISRVQLNTIDNASGAQFYSDFTGISTDLASGDSYTVTVTPTWTGTVYSEGYAVWIDYNNDGDFTDSGELVWSKAASTNTPNSGTFTVPVGASSGQTRMRVSMKYNGIPTSCESFTYGEVEDYTVNISAQTADTQAPSNPTNLTASNITDTSVTLNWNASSDNVGVTEYDVYQNNTMLGTVTGTTANVTGLTSATTYSYNVTAKDAAGNVSGYSNTETITTSGGAVSYCSSTSTNTNDEYISRVQLNTINNSSGAQFYSDFTAISTSLAKGSSNTITVTPTWTGTVYSEGYAVWIDYNQDGDFADSGELVWSKAASTNTPNSGTFTVPSNATDGATRMRVSMKYNGIPTSCESFTYGEVEDYTVVVSSANADQCAGVAAYNSSTSYSIGDRVTYNNSLYERTASGWTNLGACGTQNSNSTQSEGQSNDGPPFGVDFSVYPNPVADQLNVTLVGITGTSYEVFSVSGQLVLKGAFTETINVNSLASGLYMLQIKAGDTQFIERFIKE
ncbi:Regulatory P domain of the subtilisin-like proprotein convertases and other protease [unidentified eubacterium SCB49]|nr:Regulatory P domain of the subtilisin-like proprotein convertases and other protease [unidentified eubacterium SCB49]